MIFKLIDLLIGDRMTNMSITEVNDRIENGTLTVRELGRWVRLAERARRAANN